MPQVPGETVHRYGAQGMDVGWVELIHTILWYSTIICELQGDHVDLKLDFADFNSGAPPVRSFSLPHLPNFHLPKQNQADGGTNLIKVNKT